MRAWRDRLGADRRSVGMHLGLLELEPGFERARWGRILTPGPDSSRSEVRWSLRIYSVLFVLLASGVFTGSDFSRAKSGLMAVLMATAVVHRARCYRSMPKPAPDVDS